MKRLITRLTLSILLLACLPLPARAAQLLIPGGQVLGLEIRNDTVTVAAFAQDSPGREAGLQPGDRLLRIDGNPVADAQDVRRALERSGGTVEVEVQRGEDRLRCRVVPRITPEGPQLGLYLRQGITGIGTVTYYDPQSGAFAALGHGVSDGAGQTARLIRGSAYRAGVASVRRGKSGAPGQLMGTLLAPEPVGTLTKNTPQGVFGSLYQPVEGQVIPVGKARTGPAEIRCTLAGEQVGQYQVQILRLYGSSGSGRNMLLHVTDPALLEATGGIVQGMSGSPIIQDGKLVGAVTHVLVNDPTRGYGIFIENMLKAAA